MVPHPYIDRIERAILTHSRLKTGLRRAAHGWFTQPLGLESIEAEEQAFRSWLSNLADAWVDGQTGHSVIVVHDAFHQELSRILGLAGGGDTRAAAEALLTGRAFMELSSEFLYQLVSWRHYLLVGVDAEASGDEPADARDWTNLGSMADSGLATGF